MTPPDTLADARERAAEEALRIELAKLSPSQRERFERESLALDRRAAFYVVRS